MWIKWLSLAATLSQVFLASSFAADRTNDPVVVVGANPTSYKTMGNPKSDLDTAVQGSRLVLPGLRAIETAVHSPNANSASLAAAFVSDKSGLSANGTDLISAPDPANVPLPITDAATKQFADLMIQAADQMSPGSVYKDLFNTASPMEGLQSAPGTLAIPGMKDLRAAYAELFVRRAAQIWSVQNSYIWHEAEFENDAEVLPQAQKDLQSIKSQIKQMRQQIRQAEEAIARAKEVCSMLPSPNSSDCDISGPTKQKETAEAMLNRQPVEVLGKSGKDAPKGLIAAAAYLEKTYIPAKKKEMDHAGAASKRASDLLKALVNDPIQPAKSPEALKDQVAAMRQHLKEGPTSQEALSAEANDAAIADGSTKQIIDKLWTAIQSGYQMAKDGQAPGWLQNAVLSYIKPMFSDPKEWSFAQWVKNIVALYPTKSVFGSIVGFAYRAVKSDGVAGK